MQWKNIKCVECGEFVYGYMPDEVSSPCPNCGRTEWETSIVYED